MARATHAGEATMPAERLRAAIAAKPFDQTCRDPRLARARGDVALLRTDVS